MNSLVPDAQPPPLVIPLTRDERYLLHLACRRRKMTEPELLRELVEPVLTLQRQLSSNRNTAARRSGPAAASHR